ncbi:Os01g0803250 [Oryza sativa Japonica Group]|uniref:Os01g0803250 protein n=1 Tax=Oryza sativa subsp. japonica TaxID=39947 RepID=A0A0P0V9I4_ORYSJ|nr:Os01g0803250 [Oryza sativa Japonica Group]
MSPPETDRRPGFLTRVSVGWHCGSGRDVGAPRPRAACFPGELLPRTVGSCRGSAPVAANDDDDDDDAPGRGACTVERTTVGERVNSGRTASYRVLTPKLFQLPG